MTTTYGYARTAADEDDLADQRRVLSEAGCAQVFTDPDCAANAEKPQLLALLRLLTPGDTLLVSDGARLGTSWPDRLPALAAVRQRQAHFRSLDPADAAFDTTTARGRLMADSVIAARSVVPLVGREEVEQPVAPEPVQPRMSGAPPEEPYSDAWIGPDGLGVDDDGYCITVIAGVGPAEALRRFGVHPTGPTTLALLRPLAREQIVTSQAVVAFTAGGCAVVVEDGGFQGVRRPELSAGTTAGCHHLTINADSRLVISRDGVVLVDWDGDDDRPWDGAEPEVLDDVLRAMDPADPEDWLDQLEVLCRFLGIRPTAADVAEPMLGGIASL